MNCEINHENMLRFMQHLTVIQNNHDYKTELSSSISN